MQFEWIYVPYIKDVSAVLFEKNHCRVAAQIRCIISESGQLYKQIVVITFQVL